MDCRAYKALPSSLVAVRGRVLLASVLGTALLPALAIKELRFGGGVGWLFYVICHVVVVHMIGALLYLYLAVGTLVPREGLGADAVVGEALADMVVVVDHDVVDAHDTGEGDHGCDDGWKERTGEGVESAGEILASHMQTRCIAT
jgi:hypothetical protein